MNTKKKAMLKKERESHLREDAEIVSENDSKRLQVKEKLKNFKLTQKYAEKEAFLKKPRFNDDKPKSVVTVHRSDDSEEQVDPLSLKEIILQSNDIKKITIEKVGVEDAKRVSFHFDDPELEGKGEKVVIKGESLRRLIKERSKVNKTKLKKNISRNGKKNSELGKTAREEKFRLIQGDKTKFSNFTQVDDFYESRRSGLVIRLPTEFTSEDSGEKDRRHALEVDHKNDSPSNSPENDFISKRTYSRISLTKKENVQEIPFASDNKSFVDPTKDSIKSEENELVSSRSPRFSEEKDDSQNISFEKSDDFLESKIEDFINSRENSVGSTGFNLIKDNRYKDEFGNDDDLNSIEEPAIVDDVGSITDDNYLEEVIRKDRDDNSDNEPVLKTIKYQAQILSKQKNLSHNGYYYKTVDHVELFKTGTAYLEDFKNGLRSFAFSSLGVTDSKQKSIFGICSDLPPQTCPT